MNTSTTSSAAQSLMKIIADIKKLPVDTIELSDSDDFITKYNLDSLDSVSLTVQISSELGVNFGESMDDIDALASFGTLVELIESRTV
ncbi:MULTISPECIES: acyl carrier protein [unclassified Endozoicomonas]|uniref:acyl carrier protein n=1 Tax=unclassified Endozoicomonas TaxID=2644528 RepID=UPI003BB6AF04